MINLQDHAITPTLSENAEVVHNSIFETFSYEIKTTYKCSEKIEYSGCSMEPGWNVKFKKAGKTLCTLYPKEGYFMVMVVIGKKEKPAVEEILPSCNAQLQEIYRTTEEGNRQRWLMIPLEDQDALYQDVLRLIQIRRNAK
ncbi:MAG: DUF3788 domain-containing protein [Allobaculum sp.]